MQIKEYPYISVDNFAVKEHVKIYFLTHCHTDHLSGLANKSTGRRRIYCSEFSAQCLKEFQRGRFRHVINQLQPTPLFQPREVVVDVHEQFTFTILPAHHCPGARGRVLHTGDFRADKSFMSEIRSWPALFYDPKVPKPLDNIYLDTTFCHPDYEFFPERQEAIDHSLRIIESQSPTSAVYFSSKTGLGYESLWRRIYERFGAKIHVSSDLIAVYDMCTIPGVRDAITGDPSSTRLHACGNRPLGSYLPCCPHSKDSFVCIKTTAFWYSNKTFEDPLHQDRGQRFHRIAFSMHSSMTELRAFVSLLKPRKITPLVYASSESDKSWSKEQLVTFFLPYLLTDLPPTTLEFANLNDKLTFLDSVFIMPDRSTARENEEPSVVPSKKSGISARNFDIVLVNETKQRLHDDLFNYISCIYEQPIIKRKAE